MPEPSLLPDSIQRLLTWLEKMSKETPLNVLLCALKYDENCD